MKRHTIYTIPYRRARLGKTNYRLRLKLLLSQKPRLVARLSSKNAMAQLITFEPAGDKVVATANSNQLAKLGWKGNKGNLSAAYLVGMLLARKALKEGVKEAVFDIGKQTSITGTRLYALLKGALDGGLEIPHSEDIIPSDERLAGKHIADYAKNMKSKEPEKYKKYFSLYIKNGLNPEELAQHFEMIKKKIEAM